VAADRELYLLDPVSHAPRPLTTNAVDDAFPTWSPDYTMIAFARGPAGARDIWYQDSQGEYQLTFGPTDDWYPTWSKDGWIAYSSRTAGSQTSSIRAIRVDDPTTDHEVFSGTAVRTPAWSPDGGTLALTGDVYGAKNDDVVTVLADGTGQDQLTNDPAADKNPTWSPTGKTIAFVHNAGQSGDDKDDEIYLLDVATKQVIQRLTTNGVRDGNPVWSSDGSQIAFQRASDDGFHIWVINLSDMTEFDLMPTAHGLNQDANWR
jgi:Tol biopolymer transport system component